MAPKQIKIHSFCMFFPFASSSSLIFYLVFGQWNFLRALSNARKGVFVIELLQIDRRTQRIRELSKQKLLDHAEVIKSDRNWIWKEYGICFENHQWNRNCICQRNQSFDKVSKQTTCVINTFILDTDQRNTIELTRFNLMHIYCNIDETNLFVGTCLCWYCFVE